MVQINCIFFYYGRSLRIESISNFSNNRRQTERRRKSRRWGCRCRPTYTTSDQAQSRVGLTRFETYVEVGCPVSLSHWRNYIPSQRTILCPSRCSPRAAHKKKKEALNCFEQRNRCAKSLTLKAGLAAGGSKFGIV